MDHDHAARPSPRGPTRRILLAASVLLAARPALAQPTPAAVVERLHASLTEVMRQAGRLGVRGRFDTLRPVMEAAFDLPAMTRIAIGPAWSGMSAEQQAGLTRAFAEWSVATYANRFNGYSGESFTTTGETTLRNADQMVRTTLNRTNDAPVLLNYLMRRSADGGWRIVDVYLTGTISELASRRADFTGVLAQGGPDRLAEELRRRTAELLRG
jgi:phospholipid transport system substrate-binding protein